MSKINKLAIASEYAAIESVLPMGINDWELSRNSKRILLGMCF